MQWIIIQGCKQIVAQSPIFYILNSTIISITKGWKSAKEQILNGS